MQKPLENKKVKLVLSTSQKVDEQYDKGQIKTEGMLYSKEDTVHLLYEENQTKTHIRINGKTVHVHRLGELSGDLWFVEGDERDTRYETPYGRMVLTIVTHKIEWNPKKMWLFIRYNIMSGEQLLSMNEMTIEMREIE